MRLLLLLSLTFVTNGTFLRHLHPQERTIDRYIQYFIGLLDGGDDAVETFLEQRRASPELKRLLTKKQREMQERRKISRSSPFLEQAGYEQYRVSPEFGAPPSNSFTNAQPDNQYGMLAPSSNPNQAQQAAQMNQYGMLASPSHVAGQVSAGAAQLPIDATFNQPATSQQQPFYTQPPAQPASTPLYPYGLATGDAQWNITPERGDLDDLRETVGDRLLKCLARDGALPRDVRDSIARFVSTEPVFRRRGDLEDLQLDDLSWI
jgi:hypothetical protein